MTEPSVAPSIILFDVDGTLIDSYRLYLESYSRAVEPQVGYRPSHQEIAARNPSSEREFLLSWLGAEEGNAAHARMCEHYEELHASLCEGFYDGIREMLSGLRSAGLRIGVVTGKGRRAWDITAARMDFGALEVVVTEDEVDRPKPDPEGIRAAVAAFGAETAEAVYIGDSLGDLAAGRAAGVRIGGALWPKAAGEREGYLRAAEAFDPDWMFERPADIVRAFAAWC